MVIGRSLKLVHNHHSTRPSLTPELRCHLPPSNQSHLQKVFLLQSNLLDYLLLLPPLLQVFHLRKVSQVRTVNKGLNWVVTVTLVHRSHLYLQNHLMLSVNRLHLLKVHLKVIRTNKLIHKHNLNLVPSHLHQMTTPHHTTHLIHNNVLRITITTNNSTVYLPLPRVSRMVPHLKDPIVAMGDLKPREVRHNHKLQLNKLSRDFQLLERVSQVVTPLPTLLLKLRPRALAKVLNLSLATHNSHKAAAIHTVILTTPALIMLNS